MKRILYFFILLISISSCSHRIVRNGYQISKSDYKNCEIQITKFINYNDSIEKIGEIILGESGISVSCSEAHAIEILNNEGCAINADLINITEETRPDLWSSCYRCKADFLKYKDPSSKPFKSEYYQEENVNNRVSDDRARNTVVGIFATGIGFALGYYLFQ
nr:hypothetical protein [uncultured Carboxylicivirga sp.]